MTFRDATSNVLSLYRSAAISTSTPIGVWLNLAVTNQVNPTTLAVIGTVTNLVAPTGTAFARYQVVFRQPPSRRTIIVRSTGVLADASEASRRVEQPATRSGDGDAFDFAAVGAVRF